MQYMGGKFKIKKPLGTYLRSRLRPGDLFVEPFCGGLNITTEIVGNRIASDLSPYLFGLYRALAGGWVPPENLSEEEYKALQLDQKQQQH